MALPLLSALVTSTTLLTDEGQSVAAPVAHVFTAKAITAGLASEGVGSASD